MVDEGGQAEPRPNRLKNPQGTGFEQPRLRSRSDYLVPRRAWIPVGSLTLPEILTPGPKATAHLEMHL